MSKKNYKSSSNKKGFASVLVAIVLGAVLLAGGGAVGYGAATHWTYDRNRVQATEPIEPEKPDNGNGEDNDSFINAGENKGILIKSRRLAAEEYEEYGIELQANTAYSITATVNENAVDKSVIGSVAWKNTSSEWASGKNIADYATLNQTEQFGLNFTLTVKQAFGEPIIVKVAACTDSNVYGTSQVDHLKELKSFTAKLNPSLPDNAAGRIYVGDKANTVEVTPKYGVGTITGTISNYKTTFTTNSYFKTELKNRFNAGNGTSSFSPMATIIAKGKDFNIKIDCVSTPNVNENSANGLFFGGGYTNGGITIANNFIKERGCGDMTGSSASTAGVTKIEYSITYSYGDYSVTKTYNQVDASEMFSDNPTITICCFRNDNLTTISTIDNIQLTPDNIIVYPE